MSYGFHLVVEGDYACFTRSEAKVERASYDVPTPGALEGLLKSIYWKPALQYYIDRIVVFHPIQFTNIRRNEVKSKVSLFAVKSQYLTAPLTEGTTISAALFGMPRVSCKKNGIGGCI